MSTTATVDPAGVIRCQECDATVANHRWGKVKASGWFFARDNTAYCPRHVPAWVEAWRETKRRGVPHDDHHR